ncbi:uncharacterized protein K444DRAFT_530284, partial [Hyaloscypha bicolor E]
GIATNTIRDQVMRYNPNSAIYNKSYINKRSAVLERPSADGVLRILTHMSLIYDPRTPIHVPNNILAILPPDPDITVLKQERE